MKMKQNLMIVMACFSVFYMVSAQAAPKDTYITNLDGSINVGVTTDSRLQVEATIPHPVDTVITHPVETIITHPIVVTPPTRWHRSRTVLSQDTTPPAPAFRIVTVPAGKRLVMTDIVMTHNVSTTSNTFRANIGRGPATNTIACETYGSLLGPLVSPGETVSINLSTGLNIDEGEQLCIRIGGAGFDQGISFSFSGFYEDI